MSPGQVPRGYGGLARQAVSTLRDLMKNDLDELIAEAIDRAWRTAVADSVRTGRGPDPTVLRAVGG